VGLVTIGQAPRVDVVPDMAAILGPRVEIAELGALDELARPEIERLAPDAGDEILVTRLADGSSVFVAKRHIAPRVQARIDELEARGVALTVLLCTGAFPPLRSSRPLLEPERVLLGVLRGCTFPGRLGVLTPSVRHVAQTDERWRGHGFDPVVVPLSPYETCRSNRDVRGTTVRAPAALRGAARSARRSRKASRADESERARRRAEPSETKEWPVPLPPALGSAAQSVLGETSEGAPAGEARRLDAPSEEYEEDADGIERAAAAFRAGGAGLVVMDCIGFRGETGAELRRLVDVPVLVANLLVARVAAELVAP
jgi:protein AroM